MSLTSPAAEAEARHRIVSDLRHALTLAPGALNAFMARYPVTLEHLADQCPNPETAYGALSAYADNTYERLVAEAESAVSA